MTHINNLPRTFRAWIVAREGDGELWFGQVDDALRIITIAKAATTRHSAAMIMLPSIRAFSSPLTKTLASVA